MIFISIPKGTILYRAAETYEKHPEIRKCKDTGKIGVYFSIFNPMLSDMMTIEYNKNLIVGVYKLTEDISVSIGKYSYINKIDYPKGYGVCLPKDNVSHVDFDISPILPTTIYDDELSKYHSYELFLTKNDLENVKSKNYYEMNIERCIKKYNLTKLKTYYN